MSINMKNNLIVVKGEDKTASILTWQFDKYKPVIYITYDNGKSYPYSVNDVRFFKNPRLLNIENKVVLHRDDQKFGVECIQVFNPYCRLVYKNNRTELCFYSDIEIISSALDDENANNTYKYLKNIANVTGLIVNGTNLLKSHFDNLDFVRKDSALSGFLLGTNESKTMIDCSSKHIYPFRFNISQRNAVEKAFCSSISIIEGPPGTGKTQTILNIIANAVMRGKSVAVVSSNNSAIENVLEKLKKEDVDFIAALLGNSDNKKAFISGQNTQLQLLYSWKNTIKDSQLYSSFYQLDEKLKQKNELAKLLAEQDVLKKEWTHYTAYYKSLNLSFKKPIFSKKVVAKKVLEFIAEYECILAKKATVGLLKKLILKLAYKLSSLDFMKKPTEDIIATYIWVVTKRDKTEKRINKVQLIDASKCFEKRRKSLGNKRNEFTKECIDLIVK